jgi:Zn-dependent peptidase ImmA (M78 family)
MSVQRIVEARKRIGEAQDLATVTERLLREAPSFQADLSRRQLVGRRPDLGLRVRSLPGTYSGLTAPSANGQIVVLRSEDTTVNRRYALAHELAHQLLLKVDRRTITLTTQAEERLCEMFAEHALMPTQKVRSYLHAFGVPGSPDELQQFCRHFKVSINAAVRRLSAVMTPECTTTIFTATFRKRQQYAEETAYRVDRSTSNPQMLIPRHRRLASWGLHQLVEWATTATPGVLERDEESQVALRSRARGTASWVGPAKWTALAVDLPVASELTGYGLVVVLDVSLLRPAKRDPTRRSGVPRPRRSSPGPGQLRILTGT